MKKVFVTGITGMLGFAIARKLHEKGYKIKALIRKSSSTSHLKKFRIEFVQGSLLDTAFLSRAMKGCDVVIHAAALMSDWGSKKEFYNVNFEGTKSVFNAAIKANVKKFILISTTAVYGQIETLEWDESRPYGRGCPYYNSKTLAEKYVMENKHKIPVVALRFAWIYGPRDRTSLPQLVDNLRKRRVMYINGGKAIISVVNSADAAEAVLLAINSDVSGECFNITSDEKITIKEYIDTIAEIINAPKPALSVPAFLLYPVALASELIGIVFKSKKSPLITRYRLYFLGKNHHVSCEKAKRILGYRPKIKIGEGLAKALKNLM